MVLSYLSGERYITAKHGIRTVQSHRGTAYVATHSSRGRRAKSTQCAELFFWIINPRLYPNSFLVIISITIRS